MLKSRFLAALLVVSTVSAALAAEPRHYTWQEHMVPMRDGTKLYTSIAIPGDIATPLPIILVRTPYNAAAGAALPTELAQAGYIFAFQNVRGRHQSEGTFVEMRPQRSALASPPAFDESTDAYDAIEWLVHHVPNNNGKVGLRGVSYQGFFVAAGMIDAHPALKAASPQAPQTDWFVGDDMHHRGAFFLDSVMGYVSRCQHVLVTSTQCTSGGFTYGTQDGYDFFLGLGPIRNIDARVLKGAVPTWADIMKHGTYDEFWQSRNILPHLSNIKPAVLVVGGWYDPNDFYGALRISDRLRDHSAQTPATFVAGPWTHGQWLRDPGTHIGPLSFGAATGPYFRNSIEVPFFEHYLKDGADPKLPRAIVFDTGANEWRHFQSWPPAPSVAKRIYLRERGGLAFEPPAAKSGFDEYRSDPASPVPYTPAFTTNMDPEFMAQDQRFMRRRPDVLVYESEPLPEDLTIAGPLTPRLLVSTTGTDSDWIVRVIDVHPVGEPLYLPSASQSLQNPEPSSMAGFQQLVRGDVIRAKFRNSLEKPEPMVPGKVTELQFPMDDVLHTFRKGHRIMIQIHSTWFPLIDRNPQVFTDIYSAGEGDFRPATQRVFHNAAQPSSVSVNVVPSRD